MSDPVRTPMFLFPDEGGNVAALLADLEAAGAFARANWVSAKTLKNIAKRRKKLRLLRQSQLHGGA